MKAAHKRRLLKLANHLEKGKLGHKEFDMETWNGGPKDEKGCGTVGCAIGECPIVFPKHWHFLKPAFPLSETYPVLNNTLSTVDSIMIFFGMDREDATDLFAPLSDININRKQQARRIREYVKKKEKL